MGQFPNRTTFLVSIILLFILNELPTPRQTSPHLLLLGRSLLAISLLSLLFGMFSIVSGSFSVTDAGANRTPLLFDIFGMCARRAASFGSVLSGAQAGGLLIMSRFVKCFGAGGSC